MHRYDYGMWGLWGHHGLCSYPGSVTYTPCDPCMISCFSCIRLFVTPCTVALQGPLSMGFSRHEYWIGLSFSSPGDLSDLEIEPASLASPSLAGIFFATSTILLKHYLTSLNLDVFRELCHLSHTVGLKISWNYVIKSLGLKQMWVLFLWCYWRHRILYCRGSFMPKIA